MENYALMVFILTAVGFAIIASELFIPSAGVLSLMAASCFLAAIWCAWKGWYEPGRTVWFWGYVFSLVLLLPSFVAGGLYLLPRTPFGRAIFAMPQSLEELTPFQEEERQLRGYIGHEGRALTMFSPGGMAEVDQQRFHAESEGLLIDAGTPVKVVGVRGNCLVVRPVINGQTAINSQTAGHERPGGTTADADSFGFESDVRS